VSRPKQRTPLPFIDPAHLRTHADEARVERVWQRLERNLHGTGPARLREPAPARRWVALCAAAAAGLVVGAGIDRLVDHDTRGTSGAQLVAASDVASSEVFAAGTTRREYALPGGGHIVVMPGTIVDTVSNDTAGLRLRLVRGEASVSTDAAGGLGRTTPLALVVGNAEVVTEGGALRISRRGDVAELEMLGGTAQLTSPDDELGLRRTTLRQNQMLTVPIHMRTAELPSRNEAGPPRSFPPREDGVPAMAPATPAAGSWHDRCEQGDFVGAFELLRQQAGGGRAAIAAATNPGDLACIRDAYALAKQDPGVGAQALERLVNDFPSSGLAGPALIQLANYHEQAGNVQAARSYYERYRAQAPNGPLADGALCGMMRAAGKAGDREALARLSQEYRAQYPDGTCIEEIERLLAEIAAAESGAMGPGSPTDPTAERKDAGPYEDEGSAHGPGSASGSASAAPSAGPAASPPAGTQP
jgi:hypothetical protein